MGPVVVGAPPGGDIEEPPPAPPPLPPLLCACCMLDVARRISFSVLIFCRSRFSFSFSLVVWLCAASRLANFASRSLTCRSLRSRNAR